MNLRPYQKNAIEAIESGWMEYDKQLVVMPTGSGKTILFSHLAARKLPRKTLIIAHREELVSQAISKLRVATGIQASREMSNSHASLDANVVVASIQSLGNRLFKYPKDHFSLIVCDEAHHAVSESWIKVLYYFQAKILGVTATPDRGDKKNLGKFFENVAYEISLVDLINDGYLSPIKVRTVPIKIDLNNVKQSAGDYDSTSLGNTIEPYFGGIINSIIEHAPFRKILVFLPLIATSQKFTEMCNEAGIDAIHIDGYDPERKFKLYNFSNGEHDMLCNAMLLTEGYDDPTIDCIVILRPTRSRPLYCQMVGRGTRVARGKSDLLILDFLWSHEKLSLVKPSNLIASSQEQAQVMDKIAEERALSGRESQEVLDLQGLASEAQIKREEALQERIKSNSGRKGGVVDAVEFALKYHATDIADYQPAMRWESQEITPKQKKILERAKIDTTTVNGRGQASQLIDLIFRNQPIIFASDKQKNFVKRLGYEGDVTNLTQSEARKFIAERKK